MTSAVQVINSLGQTADIQRHSSGFHNVTPPREDSERPTRYGGARAHAGGHPSLAVASRGSACGVLAVAKRCSLHRPCRREFPWSRAEFPVAQGHVADPEATDKEARGACGNAVEAFREGVTGMN